MESILMISKNTSKNPNYVSRIALLAFIFSLAIPPCAAFADQVLARVEINPEKAETFFSQFVLAGGPIVWLILLPMSVFTLYLAIYLCFAIRRKRLLPLGISSKISNIAMKVGTDGLPAKLVSAQDFISRAVYSALSRCGSTFTDRKVVKRLAAESLQEQSFCLLRRIEWCNIIANVAPMVGLFGTVFGMIRAFNLLGIAAGQPRPDQLAAAISVALITTFWGLLIAIPALVIHGVFRTRLEALVDEAAAELENLFRQISLIPGPAKSLIQQSLDAKQNLRRLVKDVSKRKTIQKKPVSASAEL
jgi:biopolymer transport protein ExbB